jgi:hypothetical protein
MKTLTLYRRHISISLFVVVAVAVLAIFFPTKHAYAIYVQYFLASPNPISYGSQTTIRAHCQDQDGIMIYDYPVYGGYPYGNVYAGGSEDVTVVIGPLYADKDYWLACGDNRITNTVYAYGYMLVDVNPPTPTTVNSFTASPSVTAINTATTLNYSGTQGQFGTGMRLYNVTDAVNYGNVTGWSGTRSTGNLAHNTTYNLYPEDSYYGEGAPTQITVTAAAPVTADMTASATTISAGQSVTFSFYANSATPPTQCQINNYNDTVALYNVAGCSSAQGRTWNTGALNTPGTYSYKFYYYLGAWNFVKTITVTVLPYCTLTAGATTPVAASGNTATLTYTTIGATSGSINNGVGSLPTSPGTPISTAFTAVGTASWALPSNWSSTNRIQVIGGGGGGAAWTYSNGGGGGAYSSVTNYAGFTYPQTINYSVGGGGGNAGYGTGGGIAGGDTWFGGTSCATSAACAKGGAGGITSGGIALGGQASAGIGTLKYSGGNGGASGYGGAGGGGAAGPNGNGGVGGNYGGGNYSGGGGGGGANGGGAGQTTSSAYWGGSGGNDGYTGTGGGVQSYPYFSCVNAGTNGGGGAGGVATGCPGLNGGGPDNSIASGYGPGGGGGGGGSGCLGSTGCGGRSGGSGGNYGGGGGGGGAVSAGSGGAQGMIYVTYTPYNFATGGSVSTPAITTSPTTFTMTVTNAASGLSGQCSASVTIYDRCSDVPGFQPSTWTASGCVPTGGNGGTCVPSGYIWNSSANACTIPPPTINTFSGPIRVRKGASANLTFTVTNPGSSCSVTGTNGFSTSIAPISGLQGTLPTDAITTNTVFTITCTNVGGTTVRTTTVGIIPITQEQ